MPIARTAVAGVVAGLVALASPGTSVADGSSSSVDVAAVPPGLPLALGAGYGDADGSLRVRRLQRALRELEWRPGRVDGVFGPRTESAVAAFQASAGLAVDGVFGRHTREAINDALKNPLRRGAGYATSAGSPGVRALQRELRRRGLTPGPVDGRYGPRTEAAVARLQRRAGLRASGAVDDRTRRLVAQTPEKGRETRPARAAENDRQRPAVPASPSRRDERLADARTGRATALRIAIVVGALLLGATALAAIVRYLRTPRRSALKPFRSEIPSVGRPQPLWGLDGKPRVLGYIWVPDAYYDHDVYLREQVRRIDALCDQRGWELVEVVADVDPRSVERGLWPGLGHALERMACGEASYMIVAHLGSLTRSSAELGHILEWLDSKGGWLIALDIRLATRSRDRRLAPDTFRSLAAAEHEHARGPLRDRLLSVREGADSNPHFEPNGNGGASG